MNVAVCSQPLNILSICTGGAGLDLGVELAIPSARTVCMVEREAFSVATLVSAMEQGLLHPAPVWSDARTFNGRAWRGAVDGLIGGIPCQPHSLAGRKQGSNDARDLWSTARRIIVQSGVWFVVIENVGGMLSAGSDEIAGAQRVFRDLSKLGFEVEGGLFTASEVGASHQRERIIILAVADHAKRGRGGQPTAGERHRCEGTFGGRGVDLAGVGLADAYSERLERIRSDARAEGRTDAGRSAGLRDGTALVDTTGFGRGEGRPEPEFRSWWYAAPRADSAVAYADSDEPSSIGGDIGKVRSLQKEERKSGHRSSLPGGSRDTSLFPPGPNELDAWREVLARSPELEPAFRRVADGVASRMDIARVDRLRMLGNGVVPLQAGYTIRTLAYRLAQRGHDRLWKLCQ